MLNYCSNRFIQLSNMFVSFCEEFLFLRFDQKFDPRKFAGFKFTFNSMNGATLCSALNFQ
jgi:hypothetical protein